MGLAGNVILYIIIYMYTRIDFGGNWNFHVTIIKSMKSHLLVDPPSERKLSLAAAASSLGRRSISSRRVANISTVSKALRATLASPKQGLGIWCKKPDLEACDPPAWPCPSPCPPGSPRSRPAHPSPPGCGTWLEDSGW